MVDKAAISKWPEVKELIDETRLADAKQRGIDSLCNRDATITLILLRLYRACMRDDQNRCFILPDSALMMDGVLSRHWKRMLKFVEDESSESAKQATRK